MSARLDRQGFALPIKRRGAATGIGREGRPVRLQRPRRRTPVPAGATYVGRPTFWSNVFAGRDRIGHVRSVILFQAWVAGDASPYILTCAGFSPAEIDALARRRVQLLASLPALAGRDLQCWCPLTSAWCHAEVLLSAVAGARP